MKIVLPDFLPKLFLSLIIIISFVALAFSFGIQVVEAQDFGQIKKTVIVGQTFAQKVIEEKLADACKTALAKTVNLFGSLGDLVNPQANLPFVPVECAKDKDGKTTAIPIKHLPFVILRVYKFLISLALYLFGFGIVVLGIIIQTDVFGGNVDYTRRIKNYFSSSFTGLLYVLFAYFIVLTILNIFNMESLLTEQIIKS